jgi:hypothetical protein
MYEKGFNFEKRRFGLIFGQPVSISTVDYTAQDQTPVLKYAQRKYKTEVRGPSLVQTPLPNASYYCVHGEYDGINPGDIILPLRADSDTPRLTFISKSPFEEMTAFRTSRLGAIYNGSTLLYDNIYFEYATTVNYSDKPIHNKVLASDGTPTNQIIMYTRDLRTSGYDTEGLLFYDKTDNPNTVWVIQQSTDVGNMSELTVKLSEIQ